MWFRWDARLKPSSGSEIPVVPSSSFVDSLSYYYNSLSHIKFPIPQMPEMRLPEFHIPYFGTGPLKRSASVTGSEFQHMDSVHSDLQELADTNDPKIHISSPDTDLGYMDALSEDGEREADEELAEVFKDAPLSFEEELEESELHRSRSMPNMGEDTVEDHDDENDSRKYLIGSTPDQ